jgi:ComF family protein
MLSDILDMLYPATCAGCGVATAFLCAACAERSRAHVRIERSGVPILAVGPYAGTLRRAILRFKRGRRDGAGPLAALLAGALARERISRETIVVPVPTSRDHVRVRGFDQGLALARELALIDDRPVLAALRKRANAHQRGRNRAERLAASKRFEAVQPALVARAEVLLLDDVVTTGATLADCAATLTACGATVRGAVVLAFA